MACELNFWQVLGRTLCAVFVFLLDKRLKWQSSFWLSFVLVWWRIIWLSLRIFIWILEGKFNLANSQIFPTDQLLSKFTANKFCSYQLFQVLFFCFVIEKSIRKRLANLQAIQETQDVHQQKRIHRAKSIFVAKTEGI